MNPEFSTLTPRSKENLNLQFERAQFQKKIMAEKTAAIAEKMIEVLNDAHEATPPNVGVEVAAKLDNNVILKISKKPEPSLFKEAFSAFAISFGIVAGYFAACKVFKEK